MTAEKRDGGTGCFFAFVKSDETAKRNEEQESKVGAGSQASAVAATVGPSEGGAEGNTVPEHGGGRASPVLGAINDGPSVVP